MSLLYALPTERTPDGLERFLEDQVNTHRQAYGRLTHHQFVELCGGLAWQCGRAVSSSVEISGQPKLRVDVIATDLHGSKRPICVWCMVSGRTDRYLERDYYALAMEQEKWFSRTLGAKPSTWILHDREYPTDTVEDRLKYCREKKLLSDARLENIADIDGAMRELCLALWVK